jgi:hypothetical protein
MQVKEHTVVINEDIKMCMWLRCIQVEVHIPQRGRRPLKRFITNSQKAACAISRSSTFPSAFAHELWLASTALIR